jgi:hypothetical protein
MSIMNCPTEITKPERMEIPLTQGFVALVDAADYASVASMNWVAKRGPRGDVYAVHLFQDTRGRWKCVSMHRFLMAASAGKRIYHLDGDRLNNSRSENLRARRPRRSTAAQRKTAGRQYMGVHMTIWGTYRAVLRNRYVGSSKTPEGAARLRDQAAIERYGAAALLNFPESRHSSFSESALASA